ncbi:Sec14p-like phosphatidylinositol transfer family protein, putative isoform 2 [Hibiscus syriacus]|uniref:Sec14p-like phosphatidylinositol transfer family protein, putative isoform 2 n=1 Tax=Hibiscus syriacus TaxID=106335 RepID=A0A6A2ZKH7_HIBSY|nr:Sec14p-like phosphatidylinositol transfer family protein, putative isoform 2 [Hibiscus syriacus]
MGKKREKKNEAKDSGKVQDQNMANAFEYEIALQVQETNEETFEEPSSVLEDGKNVSKGKKLSKYKALVEFRCRVEESILGNYLLGKPSSDISREESAEAIEELKEIKLWGVPLLPSKRHEGTDIVLLKFLKAKNKVHEAFEMLRGTLKWRNEFKTDEIVEENLGDDFDNLGYLNSRDKEGHPLYYNMYGALKDDQIQHKILGSEEKREKFLRWRVQFMEKAIKELEFEAGGTNSIVQIIDLKHSSGQTTKELRSVSRKSWKLLQDHYPELIHRNIIINVPLWFYISNVFSSRLNVQRKNSRIVIARPGKVTSTLLKFIPPENLPVEYGGWDDNGLGFNGGGSMGRVVQGRVHPDDEGSYRVLIQNEKDKKKGGSVRNSFYISEPGKIVISIGNSLRQEKKVLYSFLSRSPTSNSDLLAVRPPNDKPKQPSFGSIVGNNSVLVGFSSIHDDRVIRLQHLPHHRVPCAVPSPPVFSFFSGGGGALGGEPVKLPDLLKSSSPPFKIVNRAFRFAKFELGKPSFTDLSPDLIRLS